MLCLVNARKSRTNWSKQNFFFFFRLFAWRIWDYWLTWVLWNVIHKQILCDRLKRLWSILLVFHSVPPLGFMESETKNGINVYIKSIEMRTADHIICIMHMGIAYLIEFILKFRNVLNGIDVPILFVLSVFSIRSISVFIVWRSSDRWFTVFRKIFIKCEFPFFGKENISCEARVIYFFHSEKGSKQFLLTIRSEMWNVVCESSPFRSNIHIG